MLTLVNRNPKLHLSVYKSHHDGVLFEYQIHNDKSPLQPIIRRFLTKSEADRFIENEPVAPVKETRSAKSYPAPVHVRTGTGSK